MQPRSICDAIVAYISSKSNGGVLSEFFILQILECLCYFHIAITRINQNH